MTLLQTVDAPAGFHPFRSAVREQSGILLASEHRAFAHAEEAYDAQYDHEEPDAAPGHRLVEILREIGVPEGGSALEFGCGTGHLSYGLAQTGFFNDLVVSDGSATFVGIAKRKLDGLQTGTRPTFAVVQAEDVAELRDGLFDVIAMRSVLHHVTDFDGFVDGLMTKLAPGGALVMLEPKAESFFWMGTVMSILFRLSKAMDVEFTDRERETIQLFLDTMTFYLRRDIDKSAGEDKYAFWNSEMTAMARRNGAWLDYHPESTYSDPMKGFFDYMQYCMGFDGPLLEKMTRLTTEVREDVEGLLKGYPAPDMSGWFVLKRG